MVQAVTLTEEEIVKRGWQTRKLMTRNGALRPKIDSGKLYGARSNGGRGLQSRLVTIRSEENSLRRYIKNSQKLLLKALPEQQKMNSDTVVASVNKNQIRREREVKWHCMDSLSELRMG